MLQKSKSVLNNYEEATHLEWLETNGLGGFACSTLIGSNTRRYHGLLVAATQPPTGRMVMLSKMEEKIVWNDQFFDLGVSDYGDAIHPQGHTYLKEFTKDLCPSWLYSKKGLQIKKTLIMLHEENTIIIIYTLLRGAQNVVLELQPLIAARDYHELQNKNSQMWWDVSFKDGIFCNQAFEHTPPLYISAPNSTYHHAPNWFDHFNYSQEKERGLDYKEDLLNHGILSIPLKRDQPVGVIVSTINPSGRNAMVLFDYEIERRKSLLWAMPATNILKQLTLAADQMIVKRGDNLKSIIAGYPWFTDWGRDTMIALPGLCLSTGRFEDAKKILLAFSQHISMGMLPNRFQDNGEAPQYNNIDGTLWMFIAIHKYLEATKDTQFVLKQLLPVLKEVIEWHYKGTRYHIHVDEDELLSGGEQGQQLTWMDAKIADWVVTPRMGKAVEVQALWYNALHIYSELLALNGEDALAKQFLEKASLVKTNFKNLFWYEKGQYLYDVIDKNNIGDSSLRPNQIFAISLPYPLLVGEDAKKVLKVIEEKLLTPFGLRTLPSYDLRYVPFYEGSVFKRDASYHQGTVWSWLIGPYIDSLIRLKGHKGKTQAKLLAIEFESHLDDAAIGTISEIFNAAWPHQPKGCIAQAWSIGEFLRVVKAYQL